MSVDSRPRNLIELSDHWRPHRSLAVSYLFASEYDE
jgi:3-methyladenine DNA glycosylase/8-oxoguanine DNA glycosylase